MIKKSATSTEEDLRALALRSKPDSNLWPYLSPRMCMLGQDPIEHAPVVIKEIQQYLKVTLDAREEPCCG